MITDKRGGNPIVRTRQVRRLAREVTHGPPTPLILLYGGGSFGHPLAHQYHLQGRALSTDTLVGMAKTISAMDTLGKVLTDIFLEEGVPVVPLHTSSFVRQQKGKLIVTNYALIEDILSQGGVPLLGGDVIIADHDHTVIVSADQLASDFVRHFQSRTLLFATDVDGVYTRFPPRAHERPLSVILRKELQAMGASRAVRDSVHDVTGAMAGKLRSLLPLRQCTVTIFNGLRPKVLASVLRGESQGTCVTL